MLRDRVVTLLSGVLDSLLGESRCPTSKQAGALEALGTIPCVDFLLCKNLTAVMCSIQFQQESSSLATAALCSRSHKACYHQCH